MSKVESVSYKEFNRDRSMLRKVPVYNSKTDFGPKTDVYTKAKDFVLKNPKKVAFGALAIAGIIASTVLLATKGKPLLINLEGNKILSKADKINQQAGSVIENAEKEYNSVLNLLVESRPDNFNTVFDENGAVVRRFIEKDSAYLMQELSGEKITRESMFNPEQLSIKTIMKDVEHISDSRIKAREGFSYDKGELNSYMKGIFANIYDENPSKSKFKTIIEFKDGQLFSCIKDAKMDNENLAYKEGYKFIDDKLRKYESGVKSGLNTSKVGKEFNFDNGKVGEYRKNIELFFSEEKPEIAEKVKEHYVVNDSGKLEKQKI